MKTYNTSLINEQGCSFDTASFMSLKKLKEWAKGRGGCYSVFINGELKYRVRNNRLYNELFNRSK